MDENKVHYVIDEQGERTAVLIDIAEFGRLVAAYEELEEIRAYDAAKASGDEALPLEQALAEIDQSRL